MPGDYGQTSQKIVDLLLAAGYRRVRLEGLSEFDKIVGGMAWCVSAKSRHQFLFEEGGSLGACTRTCHRMEAALIAMKCPHPVQAHHILGLEVDRLWPVLQWLVRRKLNRRVARVKARIDTINKAPDDNEQQQQQHQQQHQQSGTTQQQQQHQSVSVGVGSVHETEELTAQDHDATQTRQQQQQQQQQQQHQQQQQQQKQQKQQQQQQKQTKPVSLRRRREELQQVVAAATQRLHEAQKELAAQQQHCERLKQETEKTRAMQAEISQGHERVAEAMTQLVSKHESLRQQQGKLQEEQQQQRRAMEAEAEALREAIVGAQEKAQQAQEQHKDTQQQLHQAKVAAAAALRKAEKVRRRADELPSRAELLQYEKRFAELFEVSQQRLEETRKYYDLYNTYDQVRQALTHETELLSQVEQGLRSSMKDEEARNEFLLSLSAAIDVFDESAHKAAADLARHNETRNQLKDQYSGLLSRQRQYFGALHDFRRECLRNERLLEALAKWRDLAQQRQADDLVAKCDAAP